MMIDTTRSALAPRNNDDNTSFKETKEDDAMDLLVRNVSAVQLDDEKGPSLPMMVTSSSSSPAGSDLVSRRGGGCSTRHTTTESGKATKRSTPPRPNNVRDMSADASTPTHHAVAATATRMQQAQNQQQQQSFDGTASAAVVSGAVGPCRPPLDSHRCVVAAPNHRVAAAVCASPSKMARFQDNSGGNNCNGGGGGGSFSPKLETIGGSNRSLSAAATNQSTTSATTASTTAGGGGLTSGATSSSSSPRRALAPVEQEQALFEQRLCEDAYGVAIRKINQYGKSNLRYVRCVVLDGAVENNNADNDRRSTATTRSISSRNSTGSRGGVGRRQRSGSEVTAANRSSDGGGGADGQNSNKPRRALVWGKKKDVQISLDRFTAVRRGKQTERARRNPSPASRVLSLLTDDPNHPSLDIEAPTRLDRDKFARAFARFLGVPLEGDDTHSVASAELLLSSVGNANGAGGATNPSQQSASGGGDRPHWSASLSAPGDVAPNKTSSPIVPPKKKTKALPPASPVPSPNPAESHASRDTGDAKEVVSSSNPKTLPTLPLVRDASESKARGESFHSSSNNPASSANRDRSLHRESSKAKMVAVVSNAKTPDKTDQEDGDEGSAVSSLTGHGYDQEIVEELHHALNELRGELEESRAEAARAVKVAEHAIQSAEKNSSMEWQNTVTHKAAEAAALAQKRSAEAMAKARLAEERLEGERRTAAFWRRQAEAAEEEAGALQTRAAAAEVQRAAIEEQLELERRMASSQVNSLKSRFQVSEVHQREALEAALERNRALELELDATRRDLRAKTDFQENAENAGDIPRNSMIKKLGLIGRKKRSSSSDGNDSKMLLAVHAVSSSSAQTESRDAVGSGYQQEGPPSEQFLKLHAEAANMRKQFEMLKKTTEDELRSLPLDAKMWGDQVSEALLASRTEVARLQQRLSVESASRRKLLHQVQDLRGVVRVYCRPRPSDPATNPKSSVLSLPSQETIVLHREHFSSSLESSGPLSFEFDRIFSPEATQHDVYSEIEDVCLSVLDGYNICIMAHGQSGSGKTHTILGDVSFHDRDGDLLVGIEDHGIQLQCFRQLFSVAEHRSDRYKDTFSLTIVEVHNERLCDLMAGTHVGDSRGHIVTAETKQSLRKNRSQEDDASSGRQTKLEIRTDVHGDTVVQGLVSVEVESFEDARRIWEECLLCRCNRLKEQEVDIAQYELSTHLIATLKVVSANIATGLGCIGKIQFVDLAGANLVRRRSSSAKAQSHPDEMAVSGGGSPEWRFANRSLETLSEVVTARTQFTRSVPYRNSTLTHLLRDSLEADTKVLFVACVSSDPGDVQETASTLRFASRMRRVTIGKATKHTLGPP